MSARYDELLTGLARHLGLPDPDSLLRTQELVVDGQRLGFAFEPLDANEPETGDLVCFAVLGKPQAAVEARVHRLLLEGNNLWAGTGGATLGVQRDSGAVVLAVRMPVEALSAESLADDLDGFLAVAGFWRAVVADEIDGLHAPAGQPAAAGAPFSFDQRA